MSAKKLFYLLNGCTCPEGYSENDLGQCEKIETTAATVTHSDYCLASSQRGEYTNTKTRIYNSGFANSSIALLSAPSGDVNAEMTTPDQWRNRYTFTFDGATDVDPSTDRITLLSHDFVQNTRVQYTASGGTAIGGLTPLNIYYVNVINTNTVTLSNTLGGATIDLTSDGVGATHKLMPLHGPMNIAGVWIDANCDGVKDDLTAGQQVTIAGQYNNIGEERIAYAAIGADNEFALKINGEDIAATTNSGSTYNFNILHIFPFTLKQGVNYFNAIGTGDGTVNDSIAMIIYDNTAAELIAAISDATLDILFTSEDLVGEHIDVATCPTGYDLDTSGGVGNYICIKTTITDCE